MMMLAASSNCDREETIYREVTLYREMTLYREVTLYCGVIG